MFEVVKMTVFSNNVVGTGCDGTVDKLIIIFINVAE